MSRQSLLKVFLLVVVVISAILVATSEAGWKKTARKNPERASSHSHGSHSHGGGRRSGSKQHQPKKQQQRYSTHSHQDEPAAPSTEVTPLQERLNQIKKEYEVKTREAIAAYVKEGGQLDQPGQYEGQGSVTFDAGSANEAWYETITYAVGGSLLTSIVPALVLFIIPRNIKKGVLHVMLAFASGGLLGDVFLHMLPHTLGLGHDHHHHDHSHDHSDNLSGSGVPKEHAHHDDHTSHGGTEKITTEMTMLLVLGGIGLFFVLEGLLFGHTHNHSEDSSSEDEKNKKKKKENGTEELKRQQQQQEAMEAAKKRKAARRAARKGYEDESDKEEVVPLSQRPKKFATQTGEETNKVVVTHQHQEHRGSNDKKAWLNLLADASHNFTDGVAIGASFLNSQSFGIKTVIVVLVHEIPHELGDFAVLRDCGWTTSQIVGVQLFTAIGNLAGVVAVLLATSMVNSITPYLMPVVAGTFIYVALVSILSELSECTSKLQRVLQLVAFCVGVACLKYVTLVEEKMGVCAH